MTENIFDDNDTVVHHPAYGNGHAKQRHHIQCQAEPTHENKADQDRKRDGYEYNKRGFHVAQEQKNHQGCHDGAHHSFIHHALDGVFNVYRGVVYRLEIDVRITLAKLIQLFVNDVASFYRISFACLVQADANTWFAVQTANLFLFRFKSDVRHIADFHIG